MSTRLPDCALEAQRVYQMQVGDRAGVLPYAVMADTRGQTYIEARAYLKVVGCGHVTVERKADGFHLDFSGVPGIRVPREVWGAPYRVKSVTGLQCETQAGA